MFYVREIAKLLRKNPSGIKRELDNLEKMGILESERVANLRYLKANKDSPLYSELKNLITKSLGLPGALKAVLRAVGAKAAFIYGDYAENIDTDTVDLMVIGAETSPIKEFRNIERKFKFRITWIEMEEEEYRTKRRRNDPSLKKILAAKRITLLGRT